MQTLEEEIILHNYPQSPVAEKARVVLGIKGLSWKSVEIPRLPPKPFLTQLTGGYRRTPVMQIGADIYCDSQCIIHELERRYPSPSLFPSNDAGLAWCLSRWTDGVLFDHAVQIVLGSNIEGLPADFAEDRGRLYLGPDWADGLKRANENLPHLVSQMRAPFSLLNGQLADGRNFLFGEQPAAIDAQIYHVVWFMRGRWAQGPAFFSEFQELERWEKNVENVGHGESGEMSPQKAIEIAAQSQPSSVGGVDKNDPQGLKEGMAVTVSPDVDGGEQPVEGTIVAADNLTVSIRRSDKEAGDINVHFPRAGYRIRIT